MPVDFFRGVSELPDFTDTNDFNFFGPAEQQTQFIVQLSGPAGEGVGMLGLCGDFPLGKALHSNGTALGGTLSTLAEVSGDYAPENGADYSISSFGVC